MDVSKWKKYKILKDAVGSQDGIQSRFFRKGEVELLSPDLAKCFADMGVCKGIRSDAGKPRAPEAKQEPTHANKAEKPHENKGMKK